MKTIKELETDSFYDVFNKAGIIVNGTFKEKNQTLTYKGITIPMPALQGVYIQCWKKLNILIVPFDHKEYRVSFNGRLSGAIGIFYEISDNVFGKDIEDAKRNLYEKYEHISSLKIKEC